MKPYSVGDVVSDLLIAAWIAIVLVIAPAGLILWALYYWWHL